jgi:hypothetical protein
MVFLKKPLTGDAGERSRSTTCGLEVLRKPLQREVLAGIIGGRSLSLEVPVQIWCSEKYTELGYTRWRHHPESLRSQIEWVMFHWELE